ncbi:hypothetical protein [Vibrio nigripulchritudo]|uniref:hypothetical protein n=1 Tax=Vibrio nigripulchritudo TaxID=28173 RepID=UPI002493BCF1|nr:hypothetical protein [Vibrio nigripulchritudo]BDU39399.1 hypothetical protein TUMSATVNIG2_38680 [Vibrio nigripulchritudo]BDU45119.1 hypothetical protein TUMSATVNIG3_39170 [Vibrio nigripulchritudo]
MNRRKFLERIGLAGVGSTTFISQLTNANEHKPQESRATQKTNSDSDHFFGLIVAAKNASARDKGAAHYVCNGRNDQNVINQALVDLGSKGGVVHLTPGTYVCKGAIKMRHRTSLLGSGRATILKAVGTWTSQDGEQGAVIEPLNSRIHISRVGFLSINGNRYNGANVQGIYYHINSKGDFDEGSDAIHHFEDIYIYETNQHGFHVAGSYMRATKASNIRVYNVGDEGAAEGNKAHGFFIASPDGMYHQCDAGSSAGHGFYVDHANNHFTNCKAWYSGLNGWNIRSVRGMYSVCEAQDNSGHGFYIDAGPNSLTSCHADSNSWQSDDPSADFDGFHIPWGEHIQLIACSAYDKNESNRGHWQRYGFYLGRYAEHVQILGTTIDNNIGSTGGAGITGPTNSVQVTG